MNADRNDRLRQALFRGDSLHLQNPRYRQAVDVLLGELLRCDIGAGDLTFDALGVAPTCVRGKVLANAPGVAAGLEEYSWLLERGRINVQALKKDGDWVERGDVLLEIEGERRELLAQERVGLNVLQRMSGIATVTRCLQEAVRQRHPGVFLVATRKTPWGLLDKRAVHLGGGGTHRLGLWDAVLVKNNHLALLAEGEEEAAGIAARRTWAFRRQAGFLEVEVRSRAAALAAARVWRKLQEQDAQACPCLLMLDNMSAEGMTGAIEALGSENLLEHVLIEASGNIDEANLEAVAACGVDAISMGALTHSPRALDLCQRLFETELVRT